MDSKAGREGQGASKSGKMLASLTCPEPSCGRTFSRSDHVQRHWISAHQEVRPYACELCDKRFARRDLLRRHLANRAVHGLRDPEGMAKNKRVLKACRRCASKKLKCDGDQPCGRCRKQSQDCVYERGESQLNQDALHQNDLSMDELDDSLASLPDNESFGDLRLSGRDERLSPFGGSQRVDSFPSIATESVTDDSMTTASNSYHRDVSDEEAFSPQNLRFSLTDFDTSTLDGINFDEFEMEASMEDFFNPHMVGLRDQNAMSSEMHHVMQQSPWQWMPQQPEYLMHEDHSGLSASATLSYRRNDSEYYFNNATRDKLLACVLEVLPPHERAEGGVPSLPNASMLDDLVHFSILQQSYSVDSWIRTGLYESETSKFLLYCTLAANGAVHSSVTSVVRFGYALHEVIRRRVVTLWEEDNSLTREPGIIRVHAFNLQIGLWSGYSRRMELCEALLPSTTTLVRRSGGFRSDPSRQIFVSQEATGSQIVEEWGKFVVGESLKRTAFHLFLQQIQASMAFQTPPSISVSEMKVQLPFRRDLWDAPNAETWHDIWRQSGLNSGVGNGLVVPTLFECIADTSNLMRVSHLVDLPLAAFAILNAYWHIINQQHELGALADLAIDNPLSNFLSLSSNSDAIASLLANFGATVLPAIPQEAPARPLINLYHASLGVQHYARISTLQAFAGRYGPQASRAARPELGKWCMSGRARKAVRWAAIVLQAADEMPRGALRDCAAVIVYQAALVLWSYGILCGHFASAVTSPSSPSPVGGSSNAGSASGDLVLLDGEGTAELNSFLVSGIGQPCIIDRSIGSSSGNLWIPLSNPAATVDTCRIVLEFNHRSTSQNAYLPKLVENLVRLIKNLGRIATSAS